MEPLRFTCEECGRAAGSLELIEPTDEPRHPGDLGHDHWRLDVQGPVPTTHWILRNADELRHALADGSVEELAAINPEYVNFWCRECRAVYCTDHWQPIKPTRDEGFYDLTYGTCPQGHRVVLDD